MEKHLYGNNLTTQKASFLIDNSSEEKLQEIYDLLGDYTDGFKKQLKKNMPLMKKMRRD
ncbi:MAG TPA: hypothetical protein VH396_19875 [Chitinophagaceae bacterium]